MSERYTPRDYAEPAWANAARAHEWKNYISDEVRGMWQEFTDKQQASLARQAEENAGRESWD